MADLTFRTGSSGGSRVSVEFAMHDNSAYKIPVHPASGRTSTKNESFCCCTFNHPEQVVPTFCCFLRLIISYTGLLPIFSFLNIILGIILLINPSVHIAISMTSVTAGQDPQVGPGVAAVSSTGTTLTIAISTLTLFITVPW